MRDPIPPMLLTQSLRPPSGEYLYEVKWDGIRLVAFAGAAPRLKTRRLRDVHRQFPEVTDVLSRLPAGTVLDGELVVFAQGRPSFEQVRRRLAMHLPAAVRAGAVRAPAVLMAFDLLYHRGAPLLEHPIEVRRERLEALCHGHDALIISPVFENGAALYEAVCGYGMEGIVAKRRGSPYVPGVRSPHWLKCKTAAHRMLERRRFERQRPVRSTH